MLFPIQKRVYNCQELCRDLYPKYDTEITTRNLCVLGLASGWVLSLICIIGGSFIMTSQDRIAPSEVQGKAFLISFSEWDLPPGAKNFPGHRILPLRPGLSILLNLLLNLLVTTILDATNYIHDTTLKWALHDEGRLRYNSNMRLFTSSRRHGPNSWYANVVSLLGLALTHGSLSTIIVNVVVIGTWNDKAKKFEFTPAQTADFIDINYFAVIFLGVGILLQACVSTCCLLRSRGVKTWSNSLLATAKALSYDENFDTESRIAPLISSGELQSSMLDIAPQVRLVRRLVWCFTGIFMAWSLGHGIYIAVKGYDMDNVVAWSRDVQQYWQFYGGMWMDYGRLLKSTPYWLGILIQTILQSLITLALHCVELLFKISRDEASWRCLQFTGSEIDPPILSSIQWQTLLMMTFKAIVQWVFGYAFTADETFNVALLPVIALMGLFICLLAATEYLTRKRPRGTLPATYGNFDRVLDLVDEWNHKRLFWGEKEHLSDGARLAGTAGRRLADLKPGAVYGCLNSHKVIAPPDNPLD